MRKLPVAHKAPYSNEIVKNTHASLQKTVKAALIRKKSLVNTVLSGVKIM